VPTAITVAGGPFTDYPGALENFSEPDTNDGVAAVPNSLTVSTLNLVNLTGADMIRDFDVFFRIQGQLNAFTGALVASPRFPYNMVSNLSIPYQSGSLRMVNMDGHLEYVYQQIRGSNTPNWSPYVQQQPLRQTAYGPEANLVSSATYAAPVASAAASFLFNFKVIPALFFRYFYDLDAKGNLLQYENVYVSPFLMSSTGRNTIPTVNLAPMFGATLDTSPFVQTAPLTTPATWTDTGSLVWFRRNGWRQPASPAQMPPLFNWARQIFASRFSLPSSRVRIPLPTEGQLLCIVARMWDPTLNAGQGGAIPLGNLTNLQVTYGSGIAKVNDTPQSHQDRLLRQFGWLGPAGVIIWDWFTDGGKSNRDAINTYNTASPQIRLDFGNFVPGAGSYIDVALDYLTLVSN
jgi:hypothetical protein